VKFVIVTNKDTDWDVVTRLEIPTSREGKIDAGNCADKRFL
jgi:hypothetical protein